MQHNQLVPIYLSVRA